MSSEDKQYLQNDYQRRWEMLQNRVVTPMADSSRQSFSIEQTTGSFVTSIVRVPPAAAAAPYCQQQTISVPEQKKTFEQAYKEVIEKQFGNQIKREAVARPKVVTEPIPSTSNVQEGYITTVYNITPRELPTPSRITTSDGPKRSLVIPVLSSTTSKPAMEGIKYQKAHSNAYAKQLLDITKNSLHKVEMAFTTTEPKHSSPRTAVYGQQEQATSNRTAHDKTTAAAVQKSLLRTDSNRTQQEITRRLQSQERRSAPIPSLKTFAQNGEPILVSKHRSNVMLSIIKPSVTSPAPTHVYGAPDISVPGHRNQHIFYNVQDLTEGRRLLNMVKVASRSPNEPPPAHRIVAEPSKCTYVAESNPTPSIIPQPVNHEQIQDEALNLDTKHDTTAGNGGSKIVTEKQSAPSALATASTSSVVPSQKTTVLLNPILSKKESPTIVQNIVPVPSASTVWEQLQRYNLLLANARKMLETNQVPPATVPPAEQPKQQDEIPTERSEPTDVLLPVAASTPSPTVAAAPPLIRFDYEKMFLQTLHAIKRKSSAQEQHPVKKRRSYPRKQRPLEAFVQNGPCYKVASRLPRCRECGRSASVRSKNASTIFCRFFAFRKLKYNMLGQLEVFGFADPFLDAKDTDTDLWSANLKQVPADLSVEKSKFLLGQVGYKFCELFHQEKEAYFEHMAEDKTIAWKQAVHGVREMCDVCQTTLFNHHWVCKTCGFVVCIDCYKCRKNGIITVESTTKDKDTNGWLLCSATKEPHDQTQLMLTQIIPSKCLYKLIRQMHGICALLEIPLNCECPLSQEPLFRKFKDQLEFIYPLAGSEPTSGGEVSVTIKQVEQVRSLDSAAGSDIDPIQCRIVFTQQCKENKEKAGFEVQAGGTSKEKQSYSFDGFVREIHTDGDHFDDRLYKIPATVSKPTVAQTDMKQELSDKEEDKMALDCNAPEEGDIKLATIANQEIPTNGVENGNGEEKHTNPSAEETSFTNGIKTQPEVEAPNLEPAIKNGESGEEDASETKTISSEQQNNKSKETMHMSIPVVPYSEKHRFKPSPPVDTTTFAMILKQMVKAEKSIFELLQPLMSGHPGLLNDFSECITIQRERVHHFVDDFLKEFIYLQGQYSTDDLTNERSIVEYIRSMRDEGGSRYRNKAERKMNLNDSKTVYTDVAHQWLCNGKLLRLLDPLDVHNYRIFHEQWERGQPVMVSAVSSKMDMDLWMPASFGRDFGEQMNDLINCLNGKIVRGHPMKVFWDGFEEISERLIDERERPMMLKLKDWPPGDDFAEMMPTRFYDLMKSLPLAEYTRREGRLNLASRLSSFFVRPDLGPKMYSAYGSALHPSKGTTNLHLDISDAVNVMVYVGIPKDVRSKGYNERIVELIDSEDCDYLTRQRVRERKELPGALWHIYHAQDADKIRALLNKIELERGGTIKPNHDPIHDQKWYLDRNMRKRLQQEYRVEGYAIVQCSGDAIFIPAGAPHQVRNLHNCIKVAEDFVSPENVSHCLKLTNEFRHLSRTHSNHEDKLQIKNIIYHTVKDAVSCITNPLIMMTQPQTGPQPAKK
ncbi:lysine-specific demethylase 3A [Anopheles maculipalpis]|uniref:lysine-specific demethylase 3A n=1 Tax=Anopheles maculipalpis TaxID=1496333 RepID=UPI002158EE59|nr:lysine-specific demethylase 3A [Anopheles maculipalpis]